VCKCDKSQLGRSVGDSDADTLEKAFAAAVNGGRRRRRPKTYEKAFF
jgi:hypothetical protein